MDIRSQSAFTLVELIIALVLVVILTTIAWPTYKNYQIRAGRTDARVTLLEKAQQAERFFVRNQSYEDAFGDDEDDNTFDSNEGRYTIEYDASPTGFTLTASPRGVQSQDNTCARFLVNHQGQKLAFDKDGASSIDSCW